MPPLRKRAFPLAVLALVLALVVVVNRDAVAQYERGNVWGRIVDRQGHPIEGITVFLVHSQIGRSYPRYTGFNGFYRFENIPVPPGGPFWIEVYWGRQLMFRDIVRLLGPQPTINLY